MGRLSKSSPDDGEDTGDVAVLPCSLLWDSGAPQDEEDIAFEAALPLVQAIRI
jgi:hypothetical protein